jgi:hypothetical protein
MKYKLLKDLPFLQSGNVFKKGTWSGGGWGVDRGTSACGSHNGVTVFESHENKILDSLLDNKQWVEVIPESVNDALTLYEDKTLTRGEFLSIIEIVIKS